MSGAVTIKWDFILDELRERAKAAVDGAAGEVKSEAEHLAPKRRVFKGQRMGRTRRLTGAELRAEQGMRKKLGLATSGPIETLAEPAGRRHVPAPVRGPRGGSSQYLRGSGRASPTRQEPVLDPPFRRVRPRSGAMQHSIAETRLNRFGRNNLRKNVRVQGRAFARRGDTERTLADVDYNRRLLRRTNTALYKGPGTGGAFELGGRLKGEIHTEDSMMGDGVITATVISPTYYARYVEFGTRHAAAQPFLRPALAKERARFRKRVAESLSRSRITGGRMV